MARRGRRSIVTGERSIELSVSIEESLYRQIGALASIRQMDRNDVVRAVLRGFFRKKLQGQQNPFTLTT